MPKIAIFGGTFDPIHWGHLLIAETAFDQFQLDRVIWVPTFRPSYKAHPLLAFEQRMEMVRRAIADHPAFTVSAIDEQQAGTSYAIATFNALQALEPNTVWYWIVGNDAFQSLPKWRGSQSLIAQCIWLVAPRGSEDEVRREGRGERGEEMEKRGEGRGVRRQESGVKVMGSKSEVEVNHFKSSQEAEQAILKNLPPSILPLSPLPLPTPSSLTPLPSLRWHQLQMPSVAISSSLIRQRCREGHSIRYLVPEAVHSYIVGQNLYQMS
ncbi:nicotinate (nicotinamide) nucleotide adenylyltransferase [Stenomitos frigidus]|uniref:nicotinate (nicotinamide) nucleotide adenylyltransferase n=1 Tax=Stenomitos frigidus TaxID=1886765 RepID=UPI001C629BE2|nr:nicotinate (nicotinamide) nucleotide adenylyltransferase [Stenomitos frigidus]